MPYKTVRNLAFPDSRLRITSAASFATKRHSTSTLLAILFVLAVLSASTNALSEEEIEGLNSFKIAIPRIMAVLPNWNQDTATYGCLFHGVYCDRERHVQAISLPSVGLQGSLPNKLDYFPWLERLSMGAQGLIGTIPSTVGNLNKCMDLSLDGNELTGTIPESICEMPLDTLDLNQNRLSGSIPPCIGQLRNLTDLDVGDNFLNGTLPDSLWTLTSLTNLGIYGNKLEGTISDQIGNLGQMRRISFAQNRFSGSLPDTIGLMIDLSEIRFNNNFLSSSIPVSFESLYNLSAIDGSFNFLNGSIPDFSRTEVGELNLAHNQLTGSIVNGNSEWLPFAALILSDNKLTGTIPDWFNGKELSIILLANNNLHGTIPDLSQCIHLMNLDLHGNELSGSFPPIPDKLQTLDLSYNKLNGSVPGGHIVGELVDLFIQHNQFEGEMPPFMVNTLLRLDISANNFTFDIFSFRSYWWLTWMNVSHNNLYGSVDDIVKTLKPYLVSVDLSYNRISDPTDWSAVGERFRTQGLTYFAVNGNPIPSLADYRAVPGLTPLNFSLLTSSYSCQILSFNSKSGEFIYDDQMFSYSACRCNENWIGKPPISCVSCSSTLPASATCDGSNSFWKEMNYYAYFDELSQLRTEPCLASPELLRTKLNPCPRVMESLSDVLSLDQHCAVGSQGRRCAQCTCPDDEAEKCFFSRDFHCVECKATLPPRGAAALFFVLIFVTLALLTAFIAKSLSNRSFLRAKPLHEQPKAMLLFLLIFARLRLATQHGLLYIIISFIQFSTELVQWNLAIEQAIFNLTNGDVTGFGLQCVFRKLNQPLYIFLIQTTAPFALLALIWIAVGIAKLISLKFIQAHESHSHDQSTSYPPVQNGSDRIDALENGKRYNASSRLLDQANPSELHYSSIQDPTDSMRSMEDSDEVQKSQNNRSARSLGISLTIAAVNLLYFGFATNTIRAFFWDRQMHTNNYFMAMHPFLQWDDPQARRIRGAARFYLSFVIVVPLIIFSLLWAFRKRARDPKVLAYLGPLFRSFTARQFWWELVLTVRKVLIAVVLGATPESSVFRPWAVVATISLFLGLQLYFQPWRRKIENFFDQLASIVLIVSYVPHFQSSGMNGGPILLITTKVIVMVFILVSIAIWIWKSVTEPLVAENPKKKSKSNDNGDDKGRSGGKSGKFLHARFKDSFMAIDPSEIIDEDDIEEADLIDGAIAASILEEDHERQIRLDNESVDGEEGQSSQDDGVSPGQDGADEDDAPPAPRSFIEGIMESMPFDPVSRLSIPNPTIQGPFGDK